MFSFMLYGSQMGGMRHSSSGLCDECNCDCYRICQKRIMACWIMDAVGLASNTLVTFTSVIIICGILYSYNDANGNNIYALAHKQNFISVNEKASV